MAIPFQRCIPSGDVDVESGNVLQWSDVVCDAPHTMGKDVARSRLTGTREEVPDWWLWHLFQGALFVTKDLRCRGYDGPRADFSWS